MLANVKVP
ncbi:hypothetical protein VTO58DRAFT_109343 [Aureobasidium pullulans]